MALDKNCMYCMNDERVSNIMVKIADLSVSTLYLFKDQSYTGRCVLACNKGHFNEIFELPVEMRNQMIDDVARVAKALKTTVNADKINYGIFGDNMPHLHFHIVPKIKGGKDWGGTFEMSPADKVFLSEEAQEALIAQIKSNL